MTRLLKTRFLWQFAAGFALGTVGMLGLQAGAPAPAAPYTVQTAIR